MASLSAEKEAYIRKKAILYGAANSALILTLHQQQMNKASQSLALANPALLHDRRKLIELARIKVDDDGYVYKHGRSRSKHFHPNTRVLTKNKRSKQPKTTENERLQRISFIEESQNGIRTLIGYKEKRREQLANAHNYGECEKISDEMSDLKRKEFEFQVELSKLRRLQQQHEWYRKNKRRKQNTDSTSKASSDNLSDTDTCSVSSRSETPVSPVRISNESEAIKLIPLSSIIPMKRKILI